MCTDVVNMLCHSLDYTLCNYNYSTSSVLLQLFDKDKKPNPKFTHLLNEFPCFWVSNHLLQHLFFCRGQRKRVILPLNRLTSVFMCSFTSFCSLTLLPELAVVMTTVRFLTQLIQMNSRLLTTMIDITKLQFYV